ARGASGRPRGRPRVPARAGRAPGTRHAGGPGGRGPAPGGVVDLPSRPAGTPRWLRKEAQMSDETKVARAAASPGPAASGRGGGSGLRVRNRLVRLGVRGAPPTTPALEPVLQAVRTNHPKSDLSVLERAYATAENAHRGQERKSGDPYITHPVAVATILAELGFDGATLAAALLHDTVEDTEYGLDDLTREYGEEIAMLVDGVTKLDKVT